MGKMGVCFKCYSFFALPFLATLHLLNTDTIIITDDLYGMENKRFKTWYFNSLSFEHNRCVTLFWPSYKKINYAIIGLPNKVQNVKVSLYVKGFGAAAVRESNHGCNEELC